VVWGPPQSVLVPPTRECTKKTHDWVVDQITDLFHLKNKSHSGHSNHSQNEQMGILVTISSFNNFPGGNGGRHGRGKHGKNHKGRGHKEDAVWYWTYTSHMSVGEWF
jgi:hypothetical protein